MLAQQECGFVSLHKKNEPSNEGKIASDPIQSEKFEAAFTLLFKLLVYPLNRLNP